jgi:alcohol-forming fatty acyl-CoA reductase
LFAEKPHLRDFAKERVIPIAGDLIIDNLGMSASDRAIVVTETQIVINCAASVNFDDPLLDALQINYFGCLRMFELARESKNILCFLHVSTAYTNSDKLGTGIFVEEKIYDLESGMDPELVVKKIVDMGPLKVQELEQEIIGNYPNTYTFTKSMAERTLKKIHGDLPISIVRPSIIISCYD